MASHLSDDDLRQKLTELGEDVGPIDETTRYLWENKYTNLLKVKKKKAAAIRSSNSSLNKSTNRNVKNKKSRLLNEFSSDENVSEPEIEPKTRYQLKSQDKPAKTRYSTRTTTVPTNSSTRNNANNLPEENVNNDVFHKRGRPSIIPHSPYSHNRRLEMDYDVDDQKKEITFRTSSPKATSSPSSFRSFFDQTLTNSQTFVPNEARNRVSNNNNNNNNKTKKLTDLKICPKFKLIDTVSNSHFISMLLPVLAALFFIFIGVIYMSSSQATLNPDSLNLSIPICHQDLLSHTATPAFPDYSCIESDYINETLQFSRELYSILSQAAGNYQCGYRSEAVMQESELKKKLEVKYKSMSSLNFFRTFMYSLLLIRENEALQIKFFYTQASKGRLYDIEKLEALNPTKTFWCRCTTALNSVMVQILAGVLVVAAIGVVYLIVSYRIKKQKQTRETIYHLVDQIIDLLKEQYDKSLQDSNLKPFLAVSHVRDILIPLAQRKALQRYWEKVVELIETQESRIKVEHKDIAGERFRVWRWLQNSNVLKNEGKIWQGQAFGSNSQGLNFLPFCPTAFLKIRNMFESQIEAGTEWSSTVKDAILDKCEGNHGIVHIHVDTSSLEGCVYVKCLDKESAYKAYRALHGWWYDGKLITVKFLRPERYHSKFPESENCRTYLKPSNSFRRSLSTTYTSSLLESS